MLLSEGTDLGGFADEDEIGKGLALNLGGCEEGARVPGFREGDRAVEGAGAVFQFLSNVSHTNSKVGEQLRRYYGRKREEVQGELIFGRDSAIIGESGANTVRVPR